ncbi:MAG: hypothetical protein ACRD3N_05335 [Terracidiphilus sp.]
MAEVLAQKPFPHFEAHPGLPDVLVRIDEDGRRTVGRFVNRTFVPYAPEPLGETSHIEE